MKCQKCGNAYANFHYSSNINGRITEYHLCSDCAGANNAGMVGFVSPSFFGPEPEFGSMFREMFGGMRGFWSSFDINMPGFVSVLPQVGILENRQEIPQTTPDAKAAVDEEMKKRREVNMLREEMRKAAEKEDFERAISLRDELRKYEG